MSYQVLARKWRPKSFSEVVGQEHVLKILSNALSLGRVHHAYLFSGTWGVGKTSIARLLAKGLNCETGITATPCGVCDNCRDIEQGRFVDLLEIDAASRTKVEDTRAILDNLQLEKISHAPKAIGLLAKAANGSMRDALSLTDQAIALDNGNALMQQIEAAAMQGADWDNLLAETITLLHQIALLQVVPTALGDYTDNEERIRFLAQYMAPNDVQLFYQILLMGRKELAFAPDKKLVLK